MILQSSAKRDVARLPRTRQSLVATAALLALLAHVSGKAVVAQPLREFAVPSDGILAVAYSSDGKQIAGGSFDATVKIWNADTGEVERSLFGHRSTVRAVAFAPHGSMVASGSDDKTAILWDARTGDRLKTLEGFERDLFALKFSADGNTLWTASSDLIAWDVATGESTLTIPLDSLFVGSIDISADGTTLVVASVNADKTVSARVFDIPSGRLLRSIGDNNFGVYSVCFLSDEKQLAGTYFNRTDGPSMRVWDIESGAVQRRFVPEFNEIWAIDLSPSGRLVATGGEGPVIEIVAPRGHRLLSEFTIWDLKSGRAKITQHGSLGRLSSLCFSPDNRRLVYCDSATVSVIDVDSGDEVWSATYGPK